MTNEPVKQVSMRVRAARFANDFGLRLRAGEFSDGADAVLIERKFHHGNLSLQLIFGSMDTLRINIHRHNDGTDACLFGIWPIEWPEDAFKKFWTIAL